MDLVKLYRSIFALGRLAFRSEIRNWPILIGRVGFFAILMLIFSRLWDAVFSSGLNAPGTPSDMLWYLAATEWIILSVPAIHMRIEDDLRDGSYAYMLARPIPYSAVRLGEAIGQLIFRMAVLAPIGFVITFLAAGIGPQPGSSLWVFLPIGFTAALVMLLFQTTIGLTALWLQEASPLYLIWQKFLFILGGLMLPLTIYPLWMQNLATWLPFYALLYAPARLALGMKPGYVSESIVLLLFWGTVALIILAVVSKLAEKQVVIGGG
jgi:ABC-2 type transport system permease protein